MIALDCDIVLVDDPAPLLSATHIRAKAEDLTFLTADPTLLPARFVSDSQPGMRARSRNRAEKIAFAPGQCASSSACSWFVAAVLAVT